jgi:hypothetical protein
MLPLIHIIGLPGSGKTALSIKLARHFKIPVFRIGNCRAKFPLSIYGEADAWVSLFKELSKQKWRNCIFESTGLNARELFLKSALPLYGIITVKLEASKKILIERIDKKSKSERGGHWLFSTTYPDKYAFVKKCFKGFHSVPADIVIDTSIINQNVVYRIALIELEPYIQFYENYRAHEI